MQRLDVERLLVVPSGRVALLLHRERREGLLRELVLRERRFTGRLRVRVRVGEDRRGRVRVEDRHRDTVAVDATAHRAGQPVRASQLPRGVAAVEGREPRLPVRLRHCLRVLPPVIGALGRLRRLRWVSSGLTRVRVVLHDPAAVRVPQQPAVVETRNRQHVRRDGPRHRHRGRGRVQLGAAPRVVPDRGGERLVELRDRTRGLDPPVSIGHGTYGEPARGQERADVRHRGRGWRVRRVELCRSQIVAVALAHGIGDSERQCLRGRGVAQRETDVDRDALARRRVTGRVRRLGPSRHCAGQADARTRCAWRRRHGRGADQ